MHVHSAYDYALLIITNLSITIIMKLHYIILPQPNVTHTTDNLGIAL